MANAKILFWGSVGVCLTVCSIAVWYTLDRYERGMLPRWAEALVMAENPYDGLYLVDPDKIDQEPLKAAIIAAQERGSEPPRIIINRYRMRYFKHLPNTPVSPTSAEICREGPEMRMYFSRRVSGYCRSEAIGEDISLIFKADGTGRLTCVDCNANIIPLNWIRVGDAP